MPFEIVFTEPAAAHYDELETDPKKLAKIRKTLGLLATNPRHPELHTHEYSSVRGANNEKVFEAYVENRTPAAYRIFWHYGPGKDRITIVAITQHP